MRQGSSGIGSGKIPPVLMRSGAVEQFKKEKPVDAIEEVPLVSGPPMENSPVQPPLEDTIEALRVLFETQEGKPVPNNKKNDAEWIKSKLNT